MKRVLALFLLFNINTICAENTIIGIVNNNVITYNSIEALLLNANSNEHKVDIVNTKINNILQLQKVKELNIGATPSDVNSALLEISKSNNISIDQLRTYPEFLSLEQEVSEKISILNLQRLVTRDIITSEKDILYKCFKEDSDIGVKQIKIGQIIISQVEAQTENNQEKEIKLFLNRLSKHIGKGASFEAFAKLHSQHQSYINSGISDWIEVNSPSLIMLASLKINEVSQIYLTDFGFAIGIKLDERHVSSNLKKCKEKLIYLNAEKYYSDWVKELRENAFIQIYYDKL